VTLSTDRSRCLALVSIKCKEATMGRELALLAAALVIGVYLTLAISPELTMTTQPDRAVACHGSDC
jgi:hypothetical protein